HGRVDAPAADRRGRDLLVKITRPHPVVALASAAGTLVRWRVHRMLPGLAAAAAVSVAAGELASHLFGHGLAPWVGLLAAGAFGLWFAADLNRVPVAPPPADIDS